MKVILAKGVSMFDRRKYRVYYSASFMKVQGTNSSTLYRKRRLVVFEGSKSQCLDWIKIQFLDAGSKLISLDKLADNIQFRIDIDTMYFPCVDINIVERTDNGSQYYDATYEVTNKYYL